MTVLAVEVQEHVLDVGPGLLFVLTSAGAYDLGVCSEKCQLEAHGITPFPFIFQINQEITIDYKRKQKLWLHPKSIHRLTD